MSKKTESFVLDRDVRELITEEAKRFEGNRSMALRSMLRELVSLRGLWTSARDQEEEK